MIGLHEQYHAVGKTKVIANRLTSWLIRCFITEGRKDRTNLSLENKVSRWLLQTKRSIMKNKHSKAWRMPLNAEGISIIT